MRLKYYLSRTDAVVDTGEAKFDEKWYDSWLASRMLNIGGADVVFFLVTDTTDVFEKEWDFNDYALHTPDSFEE